jgi:radical SAM protein with 4Fe4S-binding SPASM domain
VIRPNPYSDVPVRLYLYFVLTYARFLLTGKCLDFPLVIQLQTQSYCNGRCAICPYPVMSKNFNHGFMEPALFEKIVNELTAERSSPALVFALQNEPLLDNRIFDFIQRLKSKRRDIYCLMPTNGEPLDRFEQEIIAASGLDQLTVSLNAHRKETYEQINNGIDFDKVVHNLHALIANPSLKDKVQVRFAINEKNAPEIPKACAYWKNQGVQTKVMEITNRAGALRTYDRFKISDTQRTGAQTLRSWKRLMTGLRRTIGCELPFYQMNILYNGDVIHCCHDWNRSMVTGNVATHSIKEVWNSEKSREIRKKLLRKEYAQIGSCRECSMVG